MQSKEQRRFWAQKRKSIKPRPKVEVVLSASTTKELDELRRLYPDKKIVYNGPRVIQKQLFDTREFVDV